MSKPIKICKNYSTISLNRVNEAVEQGVEKKYIFQGVFTACSTDKKTIINRNGRIYKNSEMIKHISYLRDAIKTLGCILGELDHPDGRFDVSLKEASHKIIDLWYDTNTDCVMGKIVLLDTPNGKIAKEIVDAGYPLFVSSRAAGDVDEKTHEVEIALIFTYDIVCTPGFEEARLDRVNESMSVHALKYINESVGTAKTIKNSVSIIESSTDYKVNENIIRYINSPINMNTINQPLNEDTEEFTLPEPETNPNKMDDDKEDSKEDKNKDGKEVKDESPEKSEKLKDKKDISEEDEEAKETKRKAILKITAEDEEGNVTNSDNENTSESEQEENRSKILNIYSEEEDTEANKETEGDEDEESVEKSEETPEDDADVQEAIDRKNKVAKETDKTVDELESLLDSVIKTESIKESIIRRYPFAVSLSSTNFGKFAALRPNQKKKCAEFIEEHQIYDINAINELWSTPLRQEKKLQQNWLRLASQHDIDLYTMASKDVQDAIEESAKYVVLETLEDVDEFWNRTGLRQAEARRLMNEQFVNMYKTSHNSPYNESLNTNNDPLGYNYDYISMVESMMAEYNQYH